MSVLTKVKIGCYTLKSQNLQFEYAEKTEKIRQLW
jgi:hypothetical protein